MAKNMKNPKKQCLYTSIQMEVYKPCKIQQTLFFGKKQGLYTSI